MPKERKEDIYRDKIYQYEIGLGRSAWDWTGQPYRIERMRKTRLERARESMKKHNLNVLLCFDPTNVRYITGTITPPWMKKIPGWRSTLLIKDKDPILFEHGDVKFRTEERSPWLTDVRSSITWQRGQPGPTTDWILGQWGDQIKSIMKEYGVEKETLGFDVREIGTVKVLKDRGIETVDGQTPMIDARVIKTEDELECLRISAAQCEVIIEGIRNAIRPGITEHELKAVAHRIAYEVGAEDLGGFTIAAGPNTWPNIKFFSDRMIRPHDLIIFDTAIAGFNGYQTCYYRTFCLGQPTQKQKDFYEQTLNWLYDAIKIIKPGVTTADIANCWPDATKQWGYESEWQALANEWGHGLGLALYEPPTISRAFSLKFPFTLKENMCLALETMHGHRHDGGCRLEEMMRVTSSGVEVFSRYPIDEIVVV